MLMVALLEYLLVSAPYDPMGMRKQSDMQAFWVMPPAEVSANLSSSSCKTRMRRVRSLTRKPSSV